MSCSGKHGCRVCNREPRSETPKPPPEWLIESVEPLLWSLSMLGSFHVWKFEDRYYLVPPECIVHWSKKGEDGEVKCWYEVVLPGGTKVTVGKEMIEARKT